MALSILGRQKETVGMDKNNLKCAVFVEKSRASKQQLKNSQKHSTLVCSIWDETDSKITRC
jgi:hypothetical protein